MGALVSDTEALSVFGAMEIPKLDEQKWQMLAKLLFHRRSTVNDIFRLFSI
ncbi:hypothetical protein [Candidatus Albibeggiatoa sp. nov. BB20]|uniref:hypothetical protein n=1 Tax=Candidatus Albibeggiatoa sp. nov. BB20 TaxID=3162723 RepID=UPI0033653E03